MKPSEYVAAHAAEGRKIDAKNTVSAHTLVDEIIEFKELARVEKTSYGNPAWIIKVQDDTAFFTTSSLTRQLDKMVQEGVTVPELQGSRWIITKQHLDEDKSAGRKACDFLQFQFVENGEEEE